MKPPLTTERARELATAIARQRALDAIKRTLPARVAMILNGMDDIGPLPEAQFSAAVDQVAELLPDAQITVMFPHLYDGVGDGTPVTAAPVAFGTCPSCRRLVPLQTPNTIASHAVEGTAYECDGTGSAPIRAAAPPLVPPLYERGARVRLVDQIGHVGPGCEGTVAAIGPTGNLHVEIDGFGRLLCPPSALERIDTPKGA